MGDVIKFRRREKKSRIGGYCIMSCSCDPDGAVYMPVVSLEDPSIIIAVMCSHCGHHISVFKGELVFE